MEYESRRDADDAYHEMHNKRIGRDDLLKIEVSILQRYRCLLHRVLFIISGPEHPHLPHGVSILAAIADVIALLPVVVVRHLHVALAPNTPLVGMTGMTGTTTVMIVTMSAVTATTTVVIVIMSAVIVNVLVIDPVALMRGTVT